MDETLHPMKIESFPELPNPMEWDTDTIILVRGNLYVCKPDGAVGYKWEPIPEYLYPWLMPYT